MSYPISAPINFVNVNGSTDTLDFNATGPAGGVGNKALDFVVTTAGDMLYRDAGADNYLERLPVGTDAQVLTVVAGLPAWATTAAETFGTSVFTAFAVGSVAPIPTSQSAGANPEEWFVLDNTYVTWSDASPGTDIDNVFTTATGTFTAPATGTFEFDSVVTFDSGIGVTSGDGLSTIPAGTAVRQVQIFSVAGSLAATPLATVTRQVEAFHNNHTALSVSAVNIPLTIGDTVVVRVRHDRSAAGTVTIGNQELSLPSQTYFSGRRVR